MKNKKFAVLLLALLMLVSGSLSVSAVSFDEKLATLVEMKLVSGMGEKNGVVDYALDSDVTREQMATLVFKALGLKEEEGEVFSDVKADRWSAKFIAAVNKAGIIAGFGDGRFMPEEDVRLQDVLVMVLKAKYKAETTDLKYPDGYIELAKSKNLLDGVTDLDYVDDAERKTVFNIVYNAFVDKTSASETGEREFKDSLGRVHKLPVKVDRVAPNGHMATLALYAVAPDKLVSVGRQFKGATANYMLDSVKKLPETGAMFASSGTLNVEELIKINPQILVDVGQTTKKDMAKKMDETQTIVGLPYIMVEGVINTWPQTFRTLGDILGEKEQGEALAKYAEGVMQMADANREKIKAMNLKVYWARGKAGEETVPEGSVHTQVIEYVGLDNIAKGLTIQKGSQSAAYSPEELVKNAPDIIIADNAEIKKAMMENPLYAGVPAIKEGKVYVIPSEPYSFFTGPPAFNQLLGVKWLGNLVAPELYKLNMSEEVRTFYKLFYHYDISLDAAGALLK